MYRLAAVAVSTILVLGGGNLAAEMGWQPVESGSQAAKAIVRIKSQFGTCTGTRISTQGHVLTARHCLNQCLINSGQVEPEVLFPDQRGSYQLYHIRLNPRARCRFEIDGVEKEVQVIAAGVGFMIPSEERALPRYDETLHRSLVERGFIQRSDYAVIREIGPQSSECLHLSENDALPEELVHYMGYPGASTGRGEFDSDGSTLLQGRGEVVTSILESSCIEEVSSTEEELRFSYEQPEQILSSVDLLPGASGSALLNSNNEIVALLYSTFWPVDRWSEYCSAAAVGLRISYLRRVLLQTLGETRFEEITRCR